MLACVGDHLLYEKIKDLFAYHALHDARNERNAGVYKQTDQVRVYGLAALRRPYQILSSTRICASEYTQIRFGYEESPGAKHCCETAS